MFQTFEKIYHDQLYDNNVTPKAQFEYAWCLVRSKYPADIRKGIVLLQELYNSHEPGKRDYLYYLAFGNARIKEYSKALNYIRYIKFSFSLISFFSIYLFHIYISALLMNIFVFILYTHYFLCIGFFSYIFISIQIKIFINISIFFQVIPKYRTQQPASIVSSILNQKENGQRRFGGYGDNGWGSTRSGRCCRISNGHCEQKIASGQSK